MNATISEQSMCSAILDCKNLKRRKVLSSSGRAGRGDQLWQYISRALYLPQEETLFLAGQARTKVHTWSVPEFRNVSCCCTSSLLLSLNRGEEYLIRSSSWNFSAAALIWSGEGFSLGFASSGCLESQLSLFLVATGSPTAKLLLCSVQSSLLNQSPAHEDKCQGSKVKGFVR